MSGGRGEEKRRLRSGMEVPRHEFCIRAEGEGCVGTRMGTNCLPPPPRIPALQLTSSVSGAKVVANARGLPSSPHPRPAHSPPPARSLPSPNSPALLTCLTSPTRNPAFLPQLWVPKASGSRRRRHRPPHRSPVRGAERPLGQGSLAEGSWLGGSDALASLAREAEPASLSAALGTGLGNQVEAGERPASAAICGKLGRPG